MDYKVSKGDTLSAIAKKYKTTVANIMKLNPSIKNANKINIGQSINLTGQSKPTTSKSPTSPPPTSPPPTSAPPTPSSYISEGAITKASDEARDAKLDGINLAANGQKAQYVTNLKNAYANYQDQRNQAQTSYTKNANILREKMANMGLGATGGTYQTADNKLVQAKQDAMSTANKSQLQYADQQSQALQGIDMQRQTDLASTRAEAKLNLQQQLANQANQNLSYLTQLRAANKISEKEFNTRTGLKISGSGRSGKK